MTFSLENGYNRAGEKAHWAKTFAARPADLSFMSGTHKVEAEN